MKRIIITVTNDINSDQRMIRIADSLLELKYDVVMVGRIRRDSKELSGQNFHRFAGRACSLSCILRDNRKTNCRGLYAE